ncbi:hypothetical protein GQX73_g1004 [Xylaria multiplex]|uniref:Uncharacterized protein n=1 Tax=Xylaria multiplex TaxID=323545 RepID=A0A7C8J357_9PEZI|nr:hypothetical protein GQX73_g1004 [Xylaria multiplex]
MESPPRQRRTFPSGNVHEILDARVEKVIVIRRAIVAELHAISDRVRRLGVDIRRLGYPRRCGRAVPRALAATEAQLRSTDFEGVSAISGEDMLRVFVGAVDFAREACGVLDLCESAIRRVEVDSRRRGEWFGEICRTLDAFPGVKG